MFFSLFNFSFIFVVTVIVSFFSCCRCCGFLFLAICFQDYSIVVIKSYKLYIVLLGLLMKKKKIKIKELAEEFKGQFICLRENTR